MTIFPTASRSTEPATQRYYPPTAFTPFTIPRPSTAAVALPNTLDPREEAWLAQPPPTPTPTSRPTASPPPTPRATRSPATPRPAPIRTSASITGKASWYCKAGVSACHRDYPPGSMVAAACAPLRDAMGLHWRGKFVTVTAANDRRVTVQLVDLCASTDKTIDLYAAPFSMLAPLQRGVVRVEVGW